jgi:2-methylcitrate dehydratase PrpD
MAAIETKTQLTEAVARFAVEHEVDPDALPQARRAVIDTVGVAIAARQDPSFTILAGTLAGSAVGEATVLPTRERTSAAHAAFLNGTAGHALDYDDVADEIKGHPSVVLVPALLALGEARGASGRRVLEAFAVGFEVSCALAASLPIALHYRQGWHATATVGVLGATAGAARLLGLDVEQTRCALGVAASMAGGSRQNFGTMTKPLHAGLAARDAVLAAQLAAGGFTADPDQLEAPLGFLHLYGVEADPAVALDWLSRADVLRSRGLNVKKYPCCYNTHRTADAVLDLFSKGVQGGDVRSVRVTIEPGGLEPIIHHRPASGLQGKFSDEYVVAAALLDGEVNLATFTDEAVSRPAHQELLRKVEIVEGETPPFGPPTFEGGYAAVELTREDGSVVQERCDIPRGDARSPLDDAGIEAKFRDCVRFSAGPWDAERLLAGLRTLEQADAVGDALAGS